LVEAGVDLERAGQKFREDQRLDVATGRKKKPPLHVGERGGKKSAVAGEGGLCKSRSKVTLSVQGGERRKKGA